ncbi:hypothetical protein JYG23_04220 [Sedimentibacter sp. zth1]|uniref:hypothetical protein n=1 Tax=Sedimentibacter sp. zth1 TaxID=2816908 RepID=UPI001A91DF6B|nr:hypothetical protein [Sedimentibacter sp. zth1]QSX06667.1 hypothetical protein JYG23_04220 [Sedimentibacter sp. zth1]
MIHLLWKGARIRKGKKAKLSNADIAMLVINLPDRKRDLEPDEFKAYYEEYKRIRTETEKIITDYNLFMDRAEKIQNRCAYAYGNSVNSRAVIRD